MMFLRYENQPSFRGCLVKRSSNISLLTSTNTVIDFDQEDYDTDNIHDNSTNNERLTVPTGVSKVRVTATIHFFPVEGGFRSLTIRKNGTYPYPVADIRNAIYTSMYIPLSSPVIPVTAGDYFDLVTNQNSGSTVILDKDYIRFGMEIIE